MSSQPITLDKVTPKPPPSCPDCGEPMAYHGGTYGWIHCDYKLLYRPDGWFDEDGRHVRDRRIRDL